LTTRQDIDSTPVDLMGQHLVRVIRNAGGTTISTDRPPDIRPARGANHARAVRNLDGKHVLAFHLHGGNDHRKRRMRHVRDQRLDPQQVRTPRLVPRPGTRYGPVVLDAHE
jgi:hypothetical protein